MKNTVRPVQVFIRRWERPRRVVAVFRGSQGACPRPRHCLQRQQSMDSSSSGGSGGTSCGRAGTSALCAPGGATPGPRAAAPRISDPLAELPGGGRSAKHAQGARLRAPLAGVRSQRSLRRELQARHAADCHTPAPAAYLPYIGGMYPSLPPARPRPTNRLRRAVPQPPRHRTPLRLPASRQPPGAVARRQRPRGRRAARRQHPPAGAVPAREPPAAVRHAAHVRACMHAACM